MPWLSPGRITTLKLHTSVKEFFRLLFDLNLKLVLTNLLGEAIQEPSSSKTSVRPNRSEGGHQTCRSVEKTSKVNLPSHISRTPCKTGRQEQNKEHQSQTT
jgi:hypothetical protein